LGYLWKVLGLCGASLILSLVFVVYTNWDRTLIGLTIGIIVGFLPTLVLKVLSDLRNWNIENIEKIYAPLISEIYDLETHFSGAKEMDAYTLFDYGEIRASQLSMNKWEQIENENLSYRLYLDDKTLANELSSFYLSLEFYMKNRIEFLHSTLDPILNRITGNIPSTEAAARQLWGKISIAIRNLILDETTHEAIALGFYKHATTLFSDYEQVRILAGIPEETFDVFLVKTIKEVTGDKYGLLLEKRKELFQDIEKIKPRLQKKLEKARPV